jgi:hypothetical protein
VSVGYRLVLSFSDDDLARQGIAVDVGRPLGRTLELHLGSEMTTMPRKETPAGVATLLDIPIRAGARGLLRVGSVTIGLGPMLSAHVLSVSGLGFDGTRGGTLTAAAGLGADAVGRAPLTQQLALDVRILAEVVVPSTTFELHGRSSVEAAGLLFGLGVGLVVAVP